MINKQKLWFLTLFSLILVLSVYYITMPNDLLKVNTDENDSNIVVKVNEEDSLSVLRVLSDEEVSKICLQNGYKSLPRKPDICA